MQHLKTFMFEAAVEHASKLMAAMESQVDREGRFDAPSTFRKYTTGLRPPLLRHWLDLLVQTPSSTSLWARSSAHWTACGRSTTRCVGLCVVLCHRLHHRRVRAQDEELDAFQQSVDFLIDATDQMAKNHSGTAPPSTQLHRERVERFVWKMALRGDGACRPTLLSLVREQQEARGGSLTREFTTSSITHFFAAGEPAHRARELD